ncbi:MAG TPA: sigma-54 dependent transcriptional regulator [Gemmatimonadales bacterium]
MTTVLVVDDIKPMAEQYAYDLQRIGGYDVLVAEGGREALETLSRAAVDCVVLDLEMPAMDGFDVLRALQRDEIQVPVIVYTGTGNYDRCIQAMDLGARGFIDKAEPMERVVHEIESVIERHRLHDEVATLRGQIGSTSPIIGSSAAIRKLRERIERIATIPSPVLIVGESGSGKELVARGLHRRGDRAKGPFVALNCAALPESLVESELFGHEKGAFTGAGRTRRGAFESADRGILFLDEIGELPAAMQAKLLRVLEQNEITRVGASQPIVVDTRVVAATNRDLEREVESGGFRQDLLFRLNVHVIEVPPLRDRLSDLPDLVDHLLALTCERFGMRRKSVDDETRAALAAYDWRKNNVRELRNVVERLVIATDDDVIRVGDLPVEFGGTVSAKGGGTTFHQRRAEAERRIVVQALDGHDWQITRTAESLGLADHSSLLKLMRRLGIERT